MKKLLLVAGILALSTSVMGASSKDWAEGTVNVKAKVVQPLVFTTSDVDYEYFFKENKTNGQRQLELLK